MPHVHGIFWLSEELVKPYKNDNNEFNDLNLGPEMTTHLVQFEMVTSKGRGERNVGSWYVIDIDDMLEGKNWQ